MRADEPPLAVEAFPSYRSALRGELRRRQAVDAGYSLREFAKDLHISVASLSSVLKGTRGLSRRAARRIGERLGFDQEELANFLDLVDVEHGRAVRRRDAATARLQAFQPDTDVLERQLFERIQRWCPIYNSLAFLHALLRRIGVADPEAPLPSGDPR